MKKSILVFFVSSFALFANAQVSLKTNPSDAVVYTNAQSIQDAKKFTDNEQYDNASSIYQTMLKANPNDANIYYYYAENLLLSDNIDSAKIIFDQGKAIDPNNAFIKIGNAKILIDKLDVRETKRASDLEPNNTELKNRYTQAQDNVRQAESLIDEATRSTKDINILVEATEALLHYKNVNTDKAKTLLDKAYAMNAKNIDVLLLYGDLYAELNNGTLSADYYNKALDVDKTSARAIVSKGRLYKRSTNYDGAAREFENAISLEPNYAPAHRELGESYIKLGKLNEATIEYKKYLDISKNNCGARIRYASFLYTSKNYNEALSELNQVQQKCDSDNVSMLRLQAYSLYELKEFDKGMSVMNHLFSKLTPDKQTSKDLEYYGKFLIATNSDSVMQKGVDMLLRAISLDLNRSDLLIDVANAYSKLKNYPGAIQYLKQKINQTKDAKSADYYMLARAYYFNKQFNEADTAIQKVNELSKTYASGWLLRAQANTHIDSTSEQGLAKPFYEKYIELATADSANSTRYVNGLIEAYGYLAYYYILKKDNANGLLYLKKKLELPLEPEDKKNVQQAIDQLEHPKPPPKK